MFITLHYRILIKTKSLGCACITLWIMISNTSKKSPVILLNFKVGSLSFFSLSMYDELFTDETNFVALIYTFSILRISSFLYGHHTEAAYSSSDLTIVLYNIQNDISERCMK